MLKIIIVIATVLVVGMLSGCAAVIGGDTLGDTTEPLKTVNDLLEFHKRALSFDAIVEGVGGEVGGVGYELRVVGLNKADILQDKVRGIEGEFSGVRIEGGLVSGGLYYYVLGKLNDIGLYGGEVIGINTTMGHYFVDVKYNIREIETGTLGSLANLLGIHGAFIKDTEGNDLINSLYMRYMVGAMNDYYESNNIDKRLTFNFEEHYIDVISSNEYLELAQQAAPEVYTTIGEEVITVTTVEQPTAEGALDFTSMQGRMSTIDAGKINTVAGTSATSIAYMPALEKIFETANNTGVISGIGIYPSGDGGLRLFGYDRQGKSGTITLRYVFKSSVEEEQNIKLINIYTVNMKLETGLTVKEDVIIPEFIDRELRVLIERADRVIINNDLTALASGKVFRHLDKAVLVGFRDANSNITRNISELRRVIDRRTENNAYLLEVEVVRIEGAKGAGNLASYRDTVLYVVEQIGAEFFITDKLLVERVLTGEPSIHPESSIKRRLMALNLAGEISEEGKQEVRNVLSNLYRAGTLRVLRGPRETQVDGQTVTVDVGMYDVFNRDKAILSAADLETINESIRADLTKQGVNIQSTFSGNVVEWVGGAPNLIEVITEELIEYKGKGTGYRKVVYYLISNLEGEWVIDDRVVLESIDVSGEELRVVKDRIQGQ